MKTETTQSENTNSHLSVAFIPFTFEEVNLEKIITYIESISDQSDFDFFDSIKYHKHIENLIVNPLKEKCNINFDSENNESLKDKALKDENKNNSAFLKIYKIDNQYIQKIDKLNFNAQVHELRIDENHHLNFTNHNYIVFNEFIQVGYFVFGFEIISLNHSGLEDFANCNFFRFINKDDSDFKLKVFPIQEQKEVNSITNLEDGFEFQFKGTEKINYFKNGDELVEIILELQNNRDLTLIKERNKTTNLVLKDSNNQILDRWEIVENDRIKSLKSLELTSFNISELIKDGLFSSIEKFIHFDNIEKPNLLHIFNKSSYELINYEKLEVLLYRTVIVKSKRVSDYEMNLDLLKRTYTDIYFCALMEGVSIMDISSDYSHNALFNKYFTSFLLVLNQREVMIKFNEKLSNFTYKELSDAKSYEVIGNDTVIKDIKELKDKIGFFKFKQVIHSVSFYDDLSTFYKQLYAAFDIKLLLEDNESSVNEIHDVLVQVENNIKEKARKETEIKTSIQSFKLNMFIGTIGCLGIFTFFKDVVPFIIDEKYGLIHKTISLVAPFFMIFLVVFYFKNYKKE